MLFGMVGGDEISQEKKIGMRGIKDQEWKPEYYQNLKEKRRKKNL